jgi:uncharacterized membrane protein
MNYKHQQQEYEMQERYEGYRGREEQPAPGYEYQAGVGQQQEFVQQGPPPSSPYHFPSYGDVPPGVGEQGLENIKLGAMLSYSLGWFSGLFFLLFASQNRYVRFHALQSTLFFGVINIVDIVLIVTGVRGHLPFIDAWVNLLIVGLFLFINFVAFVGWIVGMVQAGRGKYYKLPFVGAIAEQIAGSRGTVK